MNEQNEIRGDEWAEIERCTECGEYIPTGDTYCADCWEPEPYAIEETEEELEAWYQDWLVRQ